MTEIQKCFHCEEPIDTENGMYFIGIDGNTYCEGCRESDMQSSATVVIIDPEGSGPHGDGHPRFHVGTWFHEDQWGEEPSEYTFKQTYHRTDGWRGYSETTIVGWTEIVDGWTTGGWDDPIARRKQNFNQWSEALYKGEIVAPCPVAIISDVTSNVFSTAIGVHVPDDQVEAFTEWLNGDLEMLSESLG